LHFAPVGTRLRKAAATEDGGEKRFGRARVSVLAPGTWRAAAVRCGDPLSRSCHRLPEAARIGPESAREIGYLSGLKYFRDPANRACARPGRFLDRPAASG